MLLGLQHSCTFQCRVVKTSRLPVKIATFVVTISQLLCLAFLYRWHLKKISLDWAFTLTTQPSTANLSDKPAMHWREWNSGNSTSQNFIINGVIWRSPYSYLHNTLRSMLFLACTVCCLPVTFTLMVLGVINNYVGQDCHEHYLCLQGSK